jgi:eukaryotic translation initiation factor 2C
MFFGADVSHDSSDKVSTAAIVGSLDPKFIHYGVKLSEQRHEIESRKSKEIINDLLDMVFQLIQSFKKRNRILPDILIFYRDGVDEGQFEIVNNKEISEIKKACKRIDEDYEPKITFIIVQKRHHVRFFPTETGETVENKAIMNIGPGRVIDTTVTTKNHKNFFLCSHVALKVNSKHTFYFQKKYIYFLIFPGHCTANSLLGHL